MRLPSEQTPPLRRSLSGDACERQANAARESQFAIDYKWFIALRR